MRFLSTLLLLMVPAAVFAAPPNVVFIISDDQAWTDYGFMGHPHVKTPNLDALAKQSAVFTRGYVPTALCRPSLATLITGKYAHQHKITGNDPALLPSMQGRRRRNEPEAYSRLREKLISHIDHQATVPRLLAEKGYLSHQSGKWWEGNYRRGGFTHGMTRGFPQPGGRHGDDGLKIGRDGMQPVLEFIDLAVREQKPFFVWYAPFLPHTPHNPPDRLFQKYKTMGIESDHIAKYYAMIEWFDETCGELVGYLDKKGVRNNTLIVYIADNGWIQNPDGPRFAPRSKQSPHEGGTRQPIMFSWPGVIRPGLRGEELCSSVDIVPTTLAAAGVEISQDLPGFNLLPILKTGQPTPRKAVFGETFAHDVADIDDPEASLLYRWVIEGQWKLLLTYDGKTGRYAGNHPRTDKRPQLYDLLADPHEKQNLAGEHPDVVKRLAGKLESWWPVTKRKVLTSFDPESAQAEPSAKPNIIVMLADDLGYADASCYGGKIPTPHIDRLAKEGMRFTDGHSTSSVCTPTRYGLLTGRYNWRTRLQRGVLGGLSPPLIGPDRMTIASMLKQQGYHTGCFGKWHLGMKWKLKPGKKVNELSIESRDQAFNVDFSQPAAGGPNAVGFDEYFGISASLDMVPYTFIENDRVASLPTEDRDFLMMHGRTPQRRTRKGPTAPDFDAADVLPMIAKKSAEFIDRRAKEGQPFFLYVPFASPHTPILPTEEWQGKSGINPYADFVMQTDWAVGEILAALERNGLEEETLIVFTSDNGCSPQARFDELAAKGHHPSGPFRGHKADLFEGGTRVPFVVRWPGKVPEGVTNSQLVCQVDLLATIADMIGIKLPPNAGEDSISFLEALESGEPAGRDHLVSHSINGSFAVRRGPWKLLFCGDSGGWSQPRPGSRQAKGLPPLQLYNLEKDLGETTNIAEEHPEKIRKLTDLMRRLVEQGRSTPGPKQQNDVPVNFREPKLR